MAKATKTIGENINGRLKQLGWTQTDLAKKVKLTAPYINQIVKGSNQNPSLETLEAIAHAIGFTLAELVTTKAERDALADHDVRGCFERVGEVLALARDGHDAEALALLRKKK